MRFALVQPDANAAAEMVATFHEYGFEPVLLADASSGSTDPLREGGRPQALLVCLDRVPDDAIARAAELVTVPVLKNVTLLFCGGTAAALSAAEERFPRASFTRMENVQTALASLRGL